MIASLNFSLFPSDELFTFAKGSLTIVETKKDQATGLVPFFDKASQVLVLYQSALEREKKNPFTRLLAEKDSLRDAAFMAFRTYIEAASYRATPGWAAAATKILEIVRRHGWSAAALGYKAETAVITNIVSELRNKCADELALLGVAGWLDELDAAQQDFNGVFHESVVAAPNGEPTVWEVRPQLTAALKSLFSMISLLQSATPTESLASLETALNELIVRSLATVKAADTREENQKKEEAQKTQAN